MTQRKEALAPLPVASTHGNYRDRLYANYGHDFQDSGDKFDYEAAKHWARARSYHLRGWLPTNKSARIFDAACGGGLLLHFFADLGYTDLAGVDISPDQVALAQQVAPKVTQGNVLETIESKRDSYDLITAYDIIEHFHKNEVLRFLDGCFNALKPGGRLILQTPNADTPWGTMYRYGDFSHEVCFNTNSLSRLLRMQGFQLVESRETGPVPFGYSIASTLRYAAWQVIRGGLAAWNLAETGSTCGGVYTRVFLVSATKPFQQQS